MMTDSCKPQDVAGGQDHVTPGLRVRRLAGAPGAALCCLLLLALSLLGSPLAHAADPVPGSLDTTFAAGNGKIGNLAIGTGNDNANAVAVQPDGKIVLAGYCGNGSNVDVCVARLNADGTLDTSFDGPGGSGNGKFLLPIGTGNDNANAVAVQPDGKIVLAGGCYNGSNNDFCVARLIGGPFAARQCSFDVDGDGLVTATTDVLISARVARGLRGSAVIDGIVFPANAKRNTWPLIRDYLVAQCGLSVY